MAAVYAARHRNGARAAVKVLHPDLSRHPEVRERFLREGYAANRVEHPGVVKVLDDDVVVGGPDAGTAYLVMELLEGESLQDRLERGPPLGEREFLAHRRAGARRARARRTRAASSTATSSRRTSSSCALGEARTRQPAREGARLRARAAARRADDHVLRPRARDAVVHVAGAGGGAHRRDRRAHGSLRARGDGLPRCAPGGASTRGRTPWSSCARWRTSPRRRSQRSRRR